MADVIRNDVVQIGFEVDNNPLQKLIDEIEEIKSILKGAIGDDAFSDLSKEAKKASDTIGDVGDSAKDANNDLKGVEKANFGNLKNGLKNVSQKLTEIADKASGRVFSALKKVAGISFKALGAGIAAAATGIGAITAGAVKSYADYEQLVGGVDTLFKDASGTVQKNAAKAFQTAGISANQYMETVTSFSASLINSVGGDTQKAAEMSDMALRDMSDNANKMGF